jgi:shikimate dehydrogenase
MHTAALRAVGLDDWEYQLLPLPAELFSETVRALPAAGFRGVNVTIPHKEAALALADEASEAAREIGAANTLTFEPGGAILAENTDAPALIEVLPAGFDPAGKRALVLGAGGAGRAAAWALRGAGAEVAVWNRTHGRALALAADLSVRAVTAAEPADIVVNCTSVGLEQNIDPFKALQLKADTFEAGSVAIDVVYRHGGTRFLAAARAQGASGVDGLEVLIAQGAASFERWTGRTAPRQAMREAVNTSPMS